MEWLAGILAIIVGSFAGMLPVHMAAYEAPPLFRAQRAVVLFGGDMMFDRTIRTAIDEKGGDYIFSCIDDVLHDADIVVANLEGPITSTSSRSVGSVVGGANNYTFTFATSTAQLLYEHGIRIVNLGNNHILNFGQEGLTATIQELMQSGIAYFGDPGHQRVAAGNVGGIPLAFINYNEFENSSTASTTILQIQTARISGQIPVVYTHWGIEYATTSPANSHELAHRFIDAGAEIVIGSHPHVVEEHEIYNGKHIYYSLGNFIFDQYWNDAVRRGLLLRVEFSESGVQSVREIPIELEHDRRTCLLK